MCGAGLRHRPHPAIQLPQVRPIERQRVVLASRTGLRPRSLRLHSRAVQKRFGAKRETFAPIVPGQFRCRGAGPKGRDGSFDVLVHRMTRAWIQTKDRHSPTPTIRRNRERPVAPPLAFVTVPMTKPSAKAISCVVISVAYAPPRRCRRYRHCFGIFSVVDFPML